MTIAGWTIMILAVGGVSLFLIWCVGKVLSNPDTPSHLHSSVDIEPNDLDRD